VTWLPIHSEAADVNRYKAGEIDIVYTVPINQFAQLKKTMGDQLNVAAAGDLLLRIQHHPAAV
jgi:oligopeptide transport system substrate-binding protein